MSGHKRHSSFDGREQDISAVKRVQQKHIKSMEEYEKLYKRSVEDPDGFWAEMAEKNLSWYKNGIKFLNIVLKT